MSVTPSMAYRPDDEAHDRIREIALKWYPRLAMHDPRRRICDSAMEMFPGPHDYWRSSIETNRHYKPTCRYMGWRVAKAVKLCRQGPLSLVDAVQVAATLGALGELPARFPFCHISTSRERIHGYLAECICGAFVHAGIEIPDTLYADLASYA